MRIHDLPPDCTTPGGSARPRRSRAACVLLALLAVLCLTVPGGASAHGLSWSRASFIDNGNPLLGISCPSSSLCVAGSADGLLVSTDPTGGRGTWKLVLTPPAPDKHTSPAVYGVSCPSRSLCVAWGIGGTLLTSTDPAGGPGAWTVHQSPVHDRDFGVVYCQSSTLCFAFGQTDHVLLTSTNPSGDPGSWKKSGRFRFGLDSVGCANPRLCVMGVSAPLGDVMSTTHPTGGVRAWRDAHTGNIPNPGNTGPGAITIDAIGCISAHSCLATLLCFTCARTPVPEIDRTNDPLGATRGWDAGSHGHAFDRPFAFTSGVCLPGRYCLLAASNGRVYTAGTRGGYPSVAVARGRNGNEHIACDPAGNFCALAGSDGAAYFGAR
jgi:hypothetical protein